MNRFTQSVGSLVAIVLLAGPVVAADAIATGTVKSINAAKKTFLLTDAANKDITIHFGANVVINRGGKESSTDLQVGDLVNVCYEKGTLTWSARYILVQTGDTKTWELVHGTVKSFNADLKQLTLTAADGKDHVFPMGDARVRLNNQDSTAPALKIGDTALALVDKVGDKVTLKCVMLERK